MTYLEIPLARLVLAAGLVLVAIVLSRRLHLELEGALALGAIRAAAQLVAIGYALRLLFADEHPALVLFALTVMWLVAAWTSVRRQTIGAASSGLFPRALVAIGLGAAVALVPVLAFVVAPQPWFSARFAIPLGGMMLSSAMNVVAQVLERLFAAARAEQGLVEQTLALGGTPAQALAPLERAALRAALIPTINGLVTVGLVALPGMMTGQILGGAEPEHAVRYQIVVMYQLVAVTAVSGAAIAALARRFVVSQGTWQT